MNYTQRHIETAQKQFESFVNDINCGKLEINQTNKSGRSFLHTETAMIAWYPYALDWMIDHGADVNLKDTHGVTPLHVWYAHENIALALIENGADVNAQDENGNTPFHRGIGLSEKLVDHLIAAGADLTIKNENGISRYDNILRLANETAPTDALYAQYCSVLEYVKKILKL